MNCKKLFIVTLFMMLLSLLTASAHDSHTHKAPWQACEDKEKSASCVYQNGKGDVFKGSCQLFSEALMCVRNQPIIHAGSPIKKVNKD